MQEQQNTESIVYSLPIGPKKPGQTRIHRNPKYRDGLRTLPEDCQSLASIWDTAVKTFGDKQMIEELTYNQANAKVEKVGSYLRSRGHKVFYLYAKNCANWSIADLASWTYGLVNVALYDTLGEEAFDYILQVTEGSFMFASKSSIPNLLKMLKQSKFSLNEICFWEELTAQEKAQVSSLGLKVTTFEEILATNTTARPQLSLENDLTYCFTSGTTGVPKGVVYTHRMVASEIYALDEVFSLRDTDQHMSFLPVAHIFERLVGWICFLKGSHIKYLRYPLTQFPKNLAEIRPSILTMVPRLLNRFYPLLKGMYEKEGNFDKIKAMFGGRVRLIVTGSAPVSGQILTFFSQALGCIIREAYGQTETLGGSFLTSPESKVFGNVGGPNGAIQFKLVDVPQMNYFTNTQPPYGQVCERGEPVFSKYFKNPEATAQAIDEEGWNHSGDIGMILPNGALKIVDRKKNIFKLAQGEYIAPQKIQNIYARCKFVGEVFVYGDSLSEFLVTVVVPNFDILPFVTQKMGITEKDPVKLCQIPQLAEFILKDMNEQGRKDGLHGFELAKKIILSPQPFMVSGIVTSTMKLQRFQAKKYFHNEINKAYGK